MNIAPWVEKYRPNKFDDIVLENTNKQLLKNAFGLFTKMFVADLQ